MKAAVMFWILCLFMVRVCECGELIIIMHGDGPVRRI